MSIEKNIQLQAMVFSEPLNRRLILNYEPHPLGKKYTVQVFRNHSFELVEHTIRPFLDYAGVSVEFSYGGYDDSFSFHDLIPSSDAVLLWIDASRYGGVDLNSFAAQRVEQLRLLYGGEILIVSFGCKIQLNDKTVAVLDLTPLSEKMGGAFLDLRAQNVTGTKLSRGAMLLISRELGLRYIPALLKPALKAIAVDLDNTLYKGVLGEDGIDGVELTKGHARLQQKLKEMAASGVFLCAVSKNEQGDVLELFDKREDFVLKEKDFSKIVASWSEKSKSMKEVAAFLNIGLDSILFVDDNIGELAAMNAALPDVKLLLASEAGADTCRMLCSYPGLLHLRGSREDSLRKTDVQANELRQEMQESLSNEDYIQSLHMHITYDYKNLDQMHRVSELSNKTNQFIFNYMRYSETDIARRMGDPSWGVVTVALSDNLSDSGLIGVCVGRKDGDSMELEECFISCRALGRGIDDVIVLGAISILMEQLRCNKLEVDFKIGPKNVPAQNFMMQYLQQYTEKPEAFTYSIPKKLAEIDIICH